MKKANKDNKNKIGFFIIFILIPILIIISIVISSIFYITFRNFISKIYENTENVKYDFFLLTHMDYFRMYDCKKYTENFLKNIIDSLNSGNKEKARNITWQYFYYCYHYIIPVSLNNVISKFLKSSLRDNITLLCSIMDEIVNEFSEDMFLYFYENYECYHFYQELCRDVNENPIVIPIKIGFCSDVDTIERVAKKKDKNIYIIHLKTKEIRSLEFCGIGKYGIFVFYNIPNMSEFIIIRERLSKLHSCYHYEVSYPTCTPCIKNNKCDSKYILSLFSN